VKVPAGRDRSSTVSPIDQPGDRPITDPRQSGLGRLDDLDIAALILTLAALALRLWHLQFQSLWWDEGVSIYLSGVGLRALTIAKDFSVDLHPPGYHLALAAWRVFLGPSVFSDRLLSVFCGAVSVPLTYCFVRRLSYVQTDLSRLGGDPVRSPSTNGRLRGSYAALVAALLVTISPIDIYYSQETRMYALLPVVGLLSLLLTVQLLATEKKGPWRAWVAINVIGLYTYYYLGLLTAAEALILLWVAVRRRDVVRWALAQIVTLALFLPWAILMLRRLGSSALALPAETAVHLTPTSYLLENWQDFTVGFSSPPGARWLLLLFALATLGGAVALTRRDYRVVALLALATVVPLVGAGAVLLVRPFFYPRFILFAAIPIWTLASIGLTAYRRLWPLAAIGIAAIVAGNSWTWYYERTTPRSGYAPDDYRVVFATLAASARSGDVVLCSYPWQVGYVEAYLWTHGLRATFLPGQPPPGQIAGIIGPDGRAWVYEYSPDHSFAGNHLTQTLASRERPLVVDQYGDSRVTLFAPGRTEAGPTPPLDATLGTRIGLLSAQVQTRRPLRPNDQVQVILRWRALAAPPRSYTVFVHLLGPDGKVAAQRDSPPLNGAFPTDHWRPGETLVDRYLLTIPDHVPSGTYTIEVGMYEPATGQRLIVGPAPNPDNRIMVGELTVES
jgi:mannosyltransferase